VYEDVSMRNDLEADMAHYDWWIQLLLDGVRGTPNKNAFGAEMTRISPPLHYNASGWLEMTKMPLSTMGYKKERIVAVFGVLGFSLIFK
ncbi:hypothetical protein Tco_1115329, partial [Tanacetum coccineum]